MGSLITTWKFLVVEKITESVFGADFIAEDHKSSWGFKNNQLWFDEIAIPLIDTQHVQIIKEDHSCPVIVLLWYFRVR